MEMPQEFESMRSFEDSEVQSAIKSLLEDTRFRRTVLDGMLKGIPMWAIKLYLSLFKTIDGFQRGVIYPFVLKKNPQG